MEIHPIRTDEDHTEALREIERLWGAEPGSPEGDKLDVLATLVERYEESRFPLPVADPVAVMASPCFLWSSCVWQDRQSSGITGVVVANQISE